ncbi:MAG: hypothetical protein U9N85_10320 [Bacteroidota bacterium]|nr:hypothetical protein [Bacteroidota bacterium]
MKNFTQQSNVNKENQVINFIKGASIGAIIVMVFLLLFSLSSFGQRSVYNACKAENVITREVVDVVTGETKKVEVDADTHGNAAGNQYDLAVDGAFEGETVAVLHLYTGEGFDFHLPKAALKEKGFSVYRWINNPPSAEELKKSLDKACQLWIISSHTQKLNAQHLKVIKEFFDSGKGVYIWGDNQPYYADANYVAEHLFGTKMTGNLPGNEVVTLQQRSEKIGLMPNHLISTGLQNIYEGITIATIDRHKDFTPLIYGHAGNLVTAVYEKDGKRAIIDGGFTRLYISWDNAGTGRYVKNAAAWLVNYERFGQAPIK